MPQGNLHEYAVDAEENLEKLATGLAQAGADEGTVETVEKMAEVCRKIIKALGKGQESSGDDEPPEPREKPEEQQATQEPQRQTMDSATEDLHREAQAKAAQRK